MPSLVMPYERTVAGGMSSSDVVRADRVCHSPFSYSVVFALKILINGLLPIHATLICSMMFQRRPRIIGGSVRNAYAMSLRPSTPRHQYEEGLTVCARLPTRASVSLSPVAAASCRSASGVEYLCSSYRQSAMSFAKRCHATPRVVQPSAVLPPCRYARSVCRSSASVHGMARLPRQQASAVRTRQSWPPSGVLRVYYMYEERR